MAHINSIGAGMFSDLSVCLDAADVAAVVNNPSEALLKACFASELEPTEIMTAAGGEFVRIKDVREFPAMGTPPNVVNVPVYGQSTSQQIQGQADAPSIELQVNYVPADWDSVSLLGKSVGDGKQYVFRFTLLNSAPAAFAADAMGTQNNSYYWVGKIEALQVSPQLTDANTATVTITVQSDFYGAFTGT